MAANPTNVSTGLPNNPVATLASQGIDKNLAQQGRVLGALSEGRFEAVVADARAKVNRAVRNAVREVIIEEEREGYRARTEQGGTVADLEALVGKAKFGVIVSDFPWPFEVYSGKGKQRSAERYYDAWPLERILAMAPLIKALAADDCAFLPWTVWPEHPGAHELIEACEFDVQDRGLHLGQDNGQRQGHHTRRRRPALGHGLRHALQH